MHQYLWMDSSNPTAAFRLCNKIQLLLHSITQNSDFTQRTLLFLCIGTPEIPGDSLGPHIGSYIKEYLNYPVFGTCEQPVHALNLQDTLQWIHSVYKNPIIIVIDAAIGKRYQEGFITLKKGPLYPGRGLGKQLPPVGHIQITGVFQSLYGAKAHKLVCDYVQCITDGLKLTNFVPNLPKIS